MKYLDKTNRKRCPFCKWLIGHYPSCKKYKECSHEWAGFGTTPHFRKKGWVLVHICVKCKSVRITGHENPQLDLNKWKKIVAKDREILKGKHI